MDGNNMSGNIAHLRDTFLDAEKEYLDKLKQNPEIREMIKQLNKRGGTQLARMAVQRIDSIENGLVEPQNLDEVESEIAIILAAIEDIQRERVLEKTTHRKDDDFER